MQQVFSFVLIFILVSAMTGCRPNTGGRVGVSGTVALHGQPLELGTIEFAATDGSEISGATITAGKYEISAAQGVLPGKFTVRISAVKEASGATGEFPGESTSNGVQNEELVPAEFNVASRHIVDISDDSLNEFDFAIP